MSHSTTRIDDRIKQTTKVIADRDGYSVVSVMNRAVMYGLPLVEADISSPGIEFQLDTVLALAKTFVENIRGKESANIIAIYDQAIDSAELLSELMKNSGSFLAPGGSE